MALLIVSDLHIQSGEDRAFTDLLALVKKAGKGDVLILAGDLFDLFVGNKQVFKKRYGSFFDEMKQAGERGVESHYIEGNHDFLLRSAFNGFQNLKIHSDEIVLTIGGKKFFIAHGDQVDRSDLKYMAWRLLVRSPIMKTVIAAVPGALVDRVGQASSEKSRQAKELLPVDLTREQLDHLRKIYRNYAADRLLQGYDYVVLGHCHDLDEMCFSIGDRTGQYINVGFPPVHDSYLFLGARRVKNPPRAFFSFSFSGLNFGLESVKAAHWHPAQRVA